MTDAIDAKTSDPKARGLMQGFPPAADMSDKLHDGTSWSFPNTRWSFSHQRELVPTAAIRRGGAAAYHFPQAPRKDLDAISFTTMDGIQMTWQQSLDANYTDGILVLHRGQLVYERYFGALEPYIPHLAMSVTKSLTGLMAAMLAHEKQLDQDAPVVRYVPELKETAFGDATVRHVMDMTTGVKYSETYTDPNAEVWGYTAAAGVSPRPANYTGPDNVFAFLCHLKKEGKHGKAFAYKTCNSEVLGWIVQRVAGTALPQLFSERIWQKLGVEEDAYILVDRIGAALCGGGFNSTLRDLARFGEMMRMQGSFNGRTIVPEAVVADIQRGASPAHFAKANNVTLPGWSYRHQWWVSHDNLGAYSARGIHGQAIWIAPAAEVVIARYASHPTAANANGPLDRVSLPAYRAIAEHLMKA